MILHAAEALHWAGQLRDDGSTIVTVNGVFDLFHAGHLDLLRYAAGQGDTLIVLLNSDASVRRNKGPDRPYVPAAERAYLLEALSCVDAVVVFDEDQPLQILSMVRPHVHVKGYDADPQRLAAEMTLIREWGGSVVTALGRPGRSSSQLVNQIRGACHASV